MSYRLLGTKRWSHHNFVRLTNSKNKTHGNWSTNVEPGATLGRRNYALFCVNNLASAERNLNSCKCFVGTGKLDLPIKKDEMELIFFLRILVYDFLNKPTSVNNSGTDSSVIEGCNIEEKEKSLQDQICRTDPKCVLCFKFN